MKTLRQYLTDLGPQWVSFLATTHAWILDHTTVGEGFPAPVVGKDGRIFAYCSGEVLLKFPHVEGSFNGAIYLIRDDSDGLDWDLARKGGKFVDHSGRPGPQLRIVEAAR